MDYPEVYGLLKIEQMTREQPTLRLIHLEVLGELAKINASLAPEPEVVEEPKVVAKPAKGMSKEDAEAHAERRV